MVSLDKKYDYKKSVVCSLREKKTKDVISAALFVEHSTAGGLCIEVIWFVTRRKMENQKYGSVLFRCIREMASLSGAKALLITSTAQATGFWLLHLSRLKESEKYSTPVIRSKSLDTNLKKTPKNLSERRQHHFKTTMKAHKSVPIPGADIRNFYSRFSGSSFTGKPFRYDTKSTTHVWLKVLSHTSKPLLSSALAREKEREREREEKERKEKKSPRRNQRGARLSRDKSSKKKSG